MGEVTLFHPDVGYYRTAADYARLERERDETVAAADALNSSLCREQVARKKLTIEVAAAQAELTRLRAVEAAANSEIERLQKLLNTPELHNFAQAVVLEAAHQRERWGSDHDAGKEPADWFWLLGYLSGKALRANLDGDADKAKHHTISSAAALANWHAAISGEHTAMRPGIEPPIAEACGRKGQ